MACFVRSGGRGQEQPGVINKHHVLQRTLVQGVQFPDHGTFIRLSEGMFPTPMRIQPENGRLSQ